MLQIFESSHLSVWYEERSSETTWVTFGAADARLGAPFARGFLEFRGDSGVFFMPKQDHWYQVPEIWDAMESVRAVLREQVITYGVSMGGFGALAFAKEVRASKVIAASPQVSVHPEIVPLDARYRSRVVEWQRMDAREGMCGRITLIYDPMHRLDSYNADMIAADRRIKLPMNGHAVLEPMRAVGALKALIDAVADDQDAAIPALRNARRRSGVLRTVAAGQLLTSHGHFRRASLLLRSALVDKPEAGELAHALSDALWAGGEKDAAIIADKRTIELNPDYGGHGIRCGLRLIESGQPKEAAELLRAGVRRLPKTPEILHGLATATWILGKAETSIRLKREAVSLGPAFFEWRVDLANSLWAVGDKAGAIKMDLEAVRLMPHDGGHWVRCGLRMIESGQFESAHALFRDALSKLPSIPEIHNGMHIALRFLGDFEAAFAALRTAVSLGPQFPLWAEEMRSLQNEYEILSDISRRARQIPQDQEPLFQGIGAVEVVPTGISWVHERRLRGRRIRARLSGSEATLVGRNEVDWTEQFSELANAIAALPAGLYEGVVVLNNDPVEKIGRNSDAAGYVFYCFDLLASCAGSLASKPLMARKTLLRLALEQAPAARDAVRFVEPIAGSHGVVPSWFSGVLYPDGVVSKRIDGGYTGEMDGTWVVTGARVPAGVSEQ